MKRYPFPMYVMAGSIGLAPAILRGASSVFIDSHQHQLGSPFDVKIDFAGRNPWGDARLAALAKNFIANYPTKRDYWEIVNRKLSRRLRTELPDATGFSTTLSIEPDQFYPVRRVSCVEVDPAGVETERFDFEFPAPLSGRLHRLKVGYQYPPDCPPEAIPDYRYVQQELLLYGAIHDLGAADWRRSAAAYLLARFPGLLGLSVSLDRENAAFLPAADRQSGVEPLAADGACEARRRNPAEQLVFAPAEYCSGAVLPSCSNRRYVTPPIAVGMGGAAYEAELRCVAAGLADGIVLPEEFGARARRCGLVPGESVTVSWRAAYLTHGFGRTPSPPPVVCGAPPGCFPTYRPAELLGMALPDAPLAAIVPAYLADRLIQMDGNLRKYPEAAELRLVLFRPPIRKA
jgi:hypothetical protein